MTIEDYIKKGVSPYHVVAYTKKWLKKEQFIDDVWGLDNGMLSQTLKLKRANITKKYADLMEKAFE